MATNETYISGQFYLINLNELLPDPDQPCKYMDPAALTEAEDLWLQEAERRYREYREGNLPTRPAEDVFRDAFAKLR